GATSFTNADGIAYTYIQASPQPGDNIRIAATAVADPNNSVNTFLDSAQISQYDVTDANGSVLGETGSVTSAGVATQMLTTWRRLHIERDSLGRVVNNFVSGEIVKTAPVSGSTDTILKINQTLHESNRFENG